MATIFSKAIDAVVVLFLLTIVVLVPLLDSQVVLPRGLYPALLASFFRWFTAEFDHYLAADPPPFYRGLMWLILAFFWPLSVANLYGVLARRRWAAATSLMVGVGLLTYLAAMYGEMLGSGRATPKLIRFYVPFALFAVISVLRGLGSFSSSEVSAAASSAQKKRV